MCISIAEISLCGGNCKIRNGGKPIAIQTNGCALHARGGANPICDSRLNGRCRLTTSLTFPEVWCSEHKRPTAQKCRNMSSKPDATMAPKQLYATVEQWATIGKFVRATGYSALRGQLLYQADLNTYVETSVQSLKGKYGEANANRPAPKLEKRKREETPEGASGQVGRVGKQRKPNKDVTTKGEPNRRLSETIPSPSSSGLGVAEETSIAAELFGIGSGTPGVLAEPSVGDGVAEVPGVNGWPAENDLLQELFDLDSVTLDTSFFDAYI